MTTRPLAALLFVASTCLGVSIAHVHVEGRQDPHGSADASADGGTVALPVVETNDNRRPAGTLKDGVLTLELRAARGRWHPEGGARSRYRNRSLWRWNLTALRARAPDSGSGRNGNRGQRPQRLACTPCACPASASTAATPVRPWRSAAGETRALRLQERSGRHLQLLGHQHRHAATVQGRRRYAAVGRLRRRSTWSRSRRTTACWSSPSGPA